MTSSSSSPKVRQNRFRQICFWFAVTLTYFSLLGVIFVWVIFMEIRSFEKKALKGDATAAYTLGLLNRNGTLPFTSNEKAVFWLQKASDEGSAFATNDLGYMYSHGTGVKKDLPKAFSFYERAAEKGDWLGMYNIGVNYSHWYKQDEYMVPVDYQKAYEWYMKSMKADPNTCAAYDLGLMYAKGLGVNQSEVEAKNYFMKAAHMLIYGIPEGVQIRFSKKTDVNEVEESFARYQYSQASGKIVPPIILDDKVELQKETKFLSDKIVKKCWK